MSTKTLLVIGIIIVAIAGITFFFRGGGNEPGPAAGDSSGLIVSNNAIYVAEQVPGRSVSVSVARLEKPGFVAIHEDVAGAPGKILGISSLLPAGETENLPPITLSRPTTDGETIYAMLHFDNGDDGFDTTKDKPALDSVSGAPVMMVIAISKDATEPGAVNP